MDLASIWDSHRPEGEEVVPFEEYIDDGFRWQSQDGEIWRVVDMRTAHLFFCIRMIFNHTMPVEYRIPGCKQYYFPAELWTARVCLTAMSTLMKELSRRNDIPSWMLGQMKTMKDNARRFEQDALKDVTSQFQPRVTERFLAVQMKLQPPTSFSE